MSARIARIRATRLALSLLACGLGACGGGGGGDGAPQPSTQPPAQVSPPSGSPSGWVAGSFLPASTFAGQCAMPRTGIDPLTAQPYADVQGSAVTENQWLRSWSNDLYLWYDEIVDRDPALYGTAAYFELLKTPVTTSAGTPKDKFHYTLPTAEWIELAQSGVTAGYGLQWAVISSLPPREVVVAYKQAGPAWTADVRRGDLVIMADGADVVSSNTRAEIERFLAALYPKTAGETHVLTLRDPQTGRQRTVTLRSETVTLEPVQNVKWIDTLSGRVGYMQFNDHLATAEAALVDAIDRLRAASIQDLVIDVRYNGGGLLDVASELAYMIAGTAATAGQTFESLTFNDKHRSINPVTSAPLTPVPFHSTARGFSLPPGQTLPTLDLPRVFLLTGPTTCSASESIINGLRGVGVNVVQIGSTTCGKPYGFYPKDNCGTTYFTIQFKGVNAAEFGDYTDGFAPANAPAAGGERIVGCAVADDFTHALGDPAEARLAAALAYREAQSCPVPSGAAPPGLGQQMTLTSWSATDGIVAKSPFLENRVLTAQ